MAKMRERIFLHNDFEQTRRSGAINFGVATLTKKVKRDGLVPFKAIFWRNQNGNFLS
jgi:fructose-bisphosphate aldolase class 1